MINLSQMYFRILGRTCDDHVSQHVEERELMKPVAICRLKELLAILRMMFNLLPKAPEKQWKKVALIGGGPASGCKDLIVMGYECTLFEKDPQAGGLMRTNIPSFRFRRSLDAEVDQILNGVKHRI